MKKVAQQQNLLLWILLLIACALIVRLHYLVQATEKEDDQKTEVV